MRTLFFLLLSAAAAASAGTPFDAHFDDATLRIDFYRSGDAAVERLVFDRAIRQGVWAGPTTHLLDPHPYGGSQVEVLDPGTGRVLFSRGFDTIFGEYRTTGPALRGEARTYHESVLVPFPKHPILVRIGPRNPDPAWATAEWTIDPGDLSIAREAPTPAVVTEVTAPRPPGRCLDIAILGEGYTAEDLDTFAEDVRRFGRLLIDHEPYASMEDAVCIRGVVAPSADPGCDEPRRGHWKRTALGASFNTFGSERYLLSESNRPLRDLAANVPYDTLIIMVNHDRYGGGGIYNLYCTFTAHNRWSPYLLLHEFGHSFGALADEYYSSSVAYDDLHPPKREPPAPNITALLAPDGPKWSAMVAPDTPIPTPWRKAEYDERDFAYQDRRSNLNRAIEQAWRNGETASAKELEAEAEALALDHAERMRTFLSGSPQAGVIGAFEGAGYLTRGMYRPTLDCLMFSRAVQPLCPVCRAAVTAMIERSIDPAPLQRPDGPN